MKKPIIKQLVNETGELTEDGVRLMSCLSDFGDTLQKWAVDFMEALSPFLEILNQFYIHYIDYQVTSA